MVPGNSHATRLLEYPSTSQLLWPWAVPQVPNHPCEPRIQVGPCEPRLLGRPSTKPIPWTQLSGWSLYTHVPGLPTYWFRHQTCLPKDFSSKNAHQNHQMAHPESLDRLMGEELCLPSQSVKIGRVIYFLKPVDTSVRPQGSWKIKEPWPHQWKFFILRKLRNGDIRTVWQRIQNYSLKEIQWTTRRHR